MKVVVTRYRIGDQVAAEGKGGQIGEVVALRDVSATRQVLTVKTSEGTFVPVSVDLTEGGTIVVPPASLPEAVNLAQVIATGNQSHMAVAAQLAILANAVLTMAAGVVQPTGGTNAS